MKAILSLFDVFIEAFYYYYLIFKKKNPARIGGSGFPQWVRYLRTLNT